MDVDGLAHRLRARSVGGAAAAYTAVHGHPTGHSGVEELDQPGRLRWSVRPRVAVLAGVLVLVLALGTGTVALTRSGGDVQVLASTTAGGPAGGQGGDGSAAQESGEDGTGLDAGPAVHDGSVGDGSGALGVEGAGGLAGSSGTATGGPDVAAGGPGVVVHVVGQVATPGVVTLPAGSRVADALALAGGATDAADLAAVNLARQVVDGEQVYVPEPGEALPEAAAGPVGVAPQVAGPGDGLVDLNTADATTLETLPGIGPVLSGRIVQWRADHGPFTSVDELGEVSGIGPALLGGLRDLVRV